jgi:hypothetical protein
VTTAGSRQQLAITEAAYGPDHPAAAAVRANLNLIASTEINP